MNARPENWNPPHPEEINANSLPRILLILFLTIVVLAVPGGPYIPIALPRAEDWKPTAPAAVEESGFCVVHSIHTIVQNVSGILDKLYTYRCRRLLTDKFLYRKRDTHKRIHPVLIL
jgi:hypothetical protein